MDNGREDQGLALNRIAFINKVKPPITIFSFWPYALNPSFNRLTLLNEVKHFSFS